MNTPLRKSKQRDTIFQCVQSHNDHPTADTIYREVKKEIPNISLGTIYRNLSLLVHIGKIKKVSFGDSSERYDKNLASHSHFICKDCGKIFDIPKDKEPELDLKNLSTLGNRIDEHIVTFYGHCNECLPKETKV